MLHPTFLVLLLVSTASAGSAACTRATLESISTVYLTSLIYGTPSFLGTTPDVVYIENEQRLNINNGILRAGLVLDHNRTFHDTTLCASLIEVVAASNPHQRVILTRLEITQQEVDRISKIDTVIADQGDWQFLGPQAPEKYLSRSASEDWSAIPIRELDLRTTLIAAATSYLDSFHDASAYVPYGTPCARLEGPFYTAADEFSLDKNTCPLGGTMLQPPDTLHKRRFLIDEEMGTVGVQVVMPVLDLSNPEGTASMHVIRVEEGLIRYVHEVSICNLQHCGRIEWPGTSDVGVRVARGEYMG
jgi:hypothetical protein